MQHDNLGPRNFKKSSREDEVFFEEQRGYDTEERWWWIFQNPLGIVIIVAVAILLVIGLWFVFHSPSKSANNPNDVIVIKSDNLPYKEAAPESANQSVENQDKEVYKRLGQSQADEQITGEAAVTDEEKPLEPHALPDTASTEADKKSLDQPNSLRKVTENVGVKMPEPVMNEQFIVDKNTTDTQPTVSEKVGTEAVPEVKPKEKAKPVKGLTAGTYIIRIASFRKMETADREMQRVFDTLGTALNGVGRMIKRIESDSGAFYIVTIGAFPILSKAKEISKLLKEKNFDAVIQKVNG
jgi:cell division septation protein DedD